MVNEFRVLLCNLPYQASTPQDHLSKGFDGLLLPAELAEFRNLLFSDGSTRSDVLFATHNLVNVVYTTPMREQILKYDRRITYQSDFEGVYFSATRVSQPVVSNSFFPLFTFGDYIPENNQYSEDIRIAQIGSTMAVRIYSGVDGRVFVPSVTLSFDGNNLSQKIQLHDIGITVQIGGTNVLFVASSAKTWQVYVEAPRRYDTLNILNTIKANPGVVDRMIAQPSDEVTTEYENEWRTSTNAIYKLAAILVCYVARVRTLMN